MPVWLEPGGYFRKKGEELEGRFAPSFLRCLEKEDGYSVKQWLENELKQKNCPVTAWELREKKAAFSRQWEFIRHL